MKHQAKIINNKSSEITYSFEDISQSLEYVCADEIRVVKASSSGTMFLFHCECRSPSYTVLPVDYLSSSELTISTAQCAHVAIDALIKSGNSNLKNISLEAIRAARLRHEIYFLKWECAFRQRRKFGNYELRLSFDRILARGKSMFAVCAFEVEEVCSGKFVAFFENNRGLLE